MRRDSWLLAGLPLFLACERTAAPAPADDPRLEYTIDQRIGDALADDQAAFGQISGLARDANGRLYVSDVQAAQVKVFAADGSFRYAIGRKGEGPGELSNPCCVAFDPQGRLWVRDGDNTRYSVFQPGDTAAVFVSQVRMQHNDGNRFVAVTFDGANVIDIGTRSDTVNARSTHRFTVDANGKVVRDVRIPILPPESTAVKLIERKIPNGVATLFAYQPYGSLQLVAHGLNGEWAHGVNARYAIDWRAADGSLVRHLTGDITEGPELSAEERTAAEEGLVRDRERFGTDPGFSVPARKQPLRALYFDSRGRLWVELSVTGKENRRAHIYDRDGKRVAEVSWPGEASVSYGVVSGDTIWGVATDSLGVQSIVRMRAN